MGRGGRAMPCRIIMEWLFASTLLHRASPAPASPGAQQAPSLGSRECPLDISVLWTAEVDSPVYSTPVILPSSSGGRKQIVLATLRTVELLEGDGSVPYPWPVEMDDHDQAWFLAPPALHDVDGDGVQDVCVADTMGWVRWLTPGGGGPYLPTHRQYLPRRLVTGSPQAENTPDEGAGRGGGTRGRRRLSDAIEKQQPNPGTAGDERRTGTNSAAAADEDRPGTPGTGHGSAGQGGGDGDGRWGEGEGLREDDFYADAAYAEAMRQWGEYGTGPYPADDGTGWLAAYGDDFGLDNLAKEGDVEVDPHVSAAPAFFDLDQIGKRMVVPVSYFKDDRQPLRMGGSPETVEKFVAGALACWDFRDSAWVWTHDLGQTNSGEMKKGAYVDASPTVGDIDGDGKLEVLVGTVRGGLHVVDAETGLAREGFPVAYDEIRGQVAIADVGGDGRLEMLLADASGTVACVNHDGTERWNNRLAGSARHMLTLGDVDGDGSLDVVVAIMAAGGAAEGGWPGEVWALSASSGLPLPNFPVELQNRKGISAPITLVDLHRKTAGNKGGASNTDTYAPVKHSGDAPPIGGWGRGLHLLAPSEDGHVYVIEGATGCVNKIDLGERVRSMVLADDVDGDGTLDLIVGTMTGEVVALSTNVPFHPLNAWSSQVRGPLNGFTHGAYQGVYFVGAPSDYGEIVGRNVVLTFEIVDVSARMTGADRGGGAKETSSKSNGNFYQVAIYAGLDEIFRRDYTSSGLHSATVSLANPTEVLLRIEMRTEAHSLAFEDHVFVSYNIRFHAALKWMMVGPMVLAALPLLWADRGAGSGSRASLPG